MRGTWFSPQVIRVRLERTTNGLKDHCYSVLISDIIGLTGTELGLCPSNVCPLIQFSAFLMLFTNDGKSISNRLRLNFAYILVVVTDE